MKTAPEWFGNRSLPDAVLKILGRRARSTNLKTSTFRRILGHVRKATGGKVGIYGVDGIGKTTVLKELIGCPEIKSSFDTVIYAVGVPCKDLKTDSKIVLAAQEVDVCSIMGVSKAIKIANLSSEEDWALFRDQVGGVVDSTNIQPIAQAIVNECHGIPLNLIATGKALRNVNNAIIWKLTLHDFQSIGGNDSENTLRLLKFSYDRLKGQVTKSCVLFSALYQEGHEIKSSSDGVFGQQVKKEQVLMRRGIVKSRFFAGIKEAPEEKYWKGIEMVFLMGNCISRLPEKLSCPHLVMLSLEGNVKLTAIPDSFFDEIPNLQVVNLSNTRIRTLPTSFFELSKLQALVLRDCPLFMDLPPEIGDLEHLELFDLQGTDVNNLPNEVGKLGFLKILQVSCCGPVECIKQVKLSQALLSHETISSLLLLN
ncbi:hypothetical protein RHSIM_RhsimUnG0048100 [Rhododendron simsii]|uniref:NB-ARC domain-containing protein n=1 Tax=Rhododendron simsii TaxID=118357 RepID=A0A834L4X4_RHOSS|nr:hypothetical protein RHSIM_RhsimUnG0048100 [Rhododendron simsii]